MIEVPAAGDSSAGQLAQADGTTVVQLFNLLHVRTIFKIIQDYCLIILIRNLILGDICGIDNKICLLFVPKDMWKIVK